MRAKGLASRFLSTPEGRRTSTVRIPHLVVIGFDTGATLKNAIRNQWFYGAVAQDTYMIGYYQSNWP